MSKNTLLQIFATAVGIILMIKFITTDPTAYLGGPISLLYLIGAIICLGYVAAKNIDFIMERLGLDSDYDYDYDYDEEFEDDCNYDVDYCENDTDELPDNVIPFPTHHNFG